jgi:hypothetical protein
MYWVICQNLYQSDKKEQEEQKPRCTATWQFHGIHWWNPGALWELLFGVKCNKQPSTPLIFVDLPWIAINTTFFAGLFFTSHKWSITHSYFQQHHQWHVRHLQILQCTVAPMAKGSPKYTEYYNLIQVLLSSTLLDKQPFTAIAIEMGHIWKKLQDY